MRADRRADEVDRHARRIEPLSPRYDEVAEGLDVRTDRVQDRELFDRSLADQLDEALALLRAGPHAVCGIDVEPGDSEAITFKVEEVAPSVLSAAGYRFTLEKIADAPSEVWSAAFLSDGTLILAQKSGQLLLWKNGKLQGHVRGVPAGAAPAPAHRALLP